MNDEVNPDVQSTDLALLPPPERAAIVLASSKTEAHLREMVAQAAEIKAVADAAGREMAHRAGMTLKNARVAIQKTGKAAREDATAFCTAVIAEEKRLISISEGEEKRLFSLRDAYDQKLAAEKAERERRERERLAHIRGKIDLIQRLPFESRNDSPETLRATLDDLRRMVIEADEFSEFTDEAKAAKEKAAAELADLLQQAEAREAEAARVAAERAELEAAQRKLEQERAALAREREALQAKAEPAPGFVKVASGEIDSGPLAGGISVYTDAAPAADAEPVFVGDPKAPKYVMASILMSDEEAQQLAETFERALSPWRPPAQDDQGAGYQAWRRENFDDRATTERLVDPAPGVEDVSAQDMAGKVRTALAEGWDEITAYGDGSKGRDTLANAVYQVSVGTPELDELFRRAAALAASGETLAVIGAAFKGYLDAALVAYVNAITEAEEEGRGGIFSFMPPNGNPAQA